MFTNLAIQRGPHLAPAYFTYSHGFSMALIEIDGLPFLKMVDLSIC